MKRLALASLVTAGFAVFGGAELGAAPEADAIGEPVEVGDGENPRQATVQAPGDRDTVKSVTLAFVGDVMLGRAVNETIPGRPPETFWGDVLPVLRAADAVFANLECTITEHERRWSRTRKMFHFRADPAAVDVLAAGNVRFVSLANNHVLDFEEQGLRDTLRHLDAAGIAHAGAGRDLEEAARPAMVDVAGFKVGVISLTDNEPLFAAKPGRPGTYYTKIRADPETLGPIAERAARLRAEGANLVVLSAHWGPNMVAHPRPRFQSFARAVLEAGVDLFHGHSAHVFQGVELRNEGLILYDTGDFLDDYIVDPELRNDWSFVFLVEADETGLRRLRLIPVKLGFARVDLAAGAEFEAIVELMRERSAGFGTPFAASDEGLELTIRR